jgi:PBP1b-binding outer membrane lipoprotein LpoB
MKKIATIAAIAAFTTLAACSKEEAPAEAVADEAAPVVTEAAPADPAVPGSVEATDGAVSPKEVSEDNPAAPAAQ